MSQEPEDVKPKLNLRVAFEGDCMSSEILTREGVIETD